MLQQGHDQLSVHGLAREISKADLKESVHQLIDKGLLARRDGDELPTLFVTAEGRDFLKARESVTLARRAVDGTTDPQPHDAILFEKLRELRRNIADEMSVPAYVVFGNAVLEQMALHCPIDSDALVRVKGVGRSKLEQYGPAFIAAIRDHVNSSEGSATTEPSDSSGAADPSNVNAAQGPASSDYQVGTECLLSRLVDRPVKLNGKTPGWEHILRSRVERILAPLPPREAAVLRLRFGLEGRGARTVVEIGKTFGLTGEEVRQIEDTALGRLRNSSRFTEATKLTDECGVN